MRFFSFFISKVFFKNLAIAIGLIAIVIFLVFEGLKHYTHHGKYIHVPNLENLSVAQVKRLISEKDLNYKIIDSIYSDDYIRGGVVEQMPAAGSKVKKERTIYLILNATMTEMVLIPNLKDVSIRQARTILSASGLKIDEIVYVPSEYKNLVIDQHYNNQKAEVGMKVPKGSSLNLVVGKGLGNQRVEVPELVGLTILAAKDKLMEYGLNLGALVKDGEIEDLEVDTGFVWKQRPLAAGAKVQIGSSINLWLTIDSLKLEPDTLSVENIYE